MRALFLLVAACGRLGFDELTALDAPAVPLCDAHPTALYCNDFDDRDLKGAAGDGVFDDGGLRFVAGPNEMPRLTADLGTVITTGPLFQSARFLLANGAAVDDFVVLAQFLSNAFSDKVSFDLVTFDRAQIANSNVGGSSQSDPQGVPRGRWACFELGVIADRTGNGSIELAIDGVPILGGDTTDPTVGMDGFGKAELGAFASVANGVGIDIVYDDWIVDTQPIGCR